MDTNLNREVTGPDFFHVQNTPLPADYTQVPTPDYEELLRVGRDHNTILKWMQQNLSPREMQGKKITMVKAVEMIEETFRLRREVAEINQMVLEQNFQLAQHLMQDNLRRLRQVLPEETLLRQRAEKDHATTQKMIRQAAGL